MQNSYKARRIVQLTPAHRSFEDLTSPSQLAAKNLSEIQEQGASEMESPPITGKANEIFFASFSLILDFDEGTDHNESSTESTHSG